MMHNLVINPSLSATQAKAELQVRLFSYISPSGTLFPQGHIYEKVRRTKTDVAFAQCCKGLRGERKGKRRMKSG